jgi:Zn ribbon nucleic-acid-binding protein
VELELTQPYVLRNGEPQHQNLMLIYPGGETRTGPHKLDILAEGERLLAVVRAVAEDAGVTGEENPLPPIFHLRINDRPLVGSIGKTLALNGSRGSMAVNEVLVVPGPEPKLDVMEKAPSVMKARLMGILGLSRDEHFPGATWDITPFARTLANDEWMMGMGICPQCNEPLLWMEDSCDSVCTRCGTATKQIDTEFRASFTTHSSITRTNYYERRDHMKTILKDIQGKESKDVPEEVYDDVIVYLYTSRLLDPENADTETIREALKRTGHSNCYRNINTILFKLFNIPPPSISDKEVKTILSKFMELQDHWQQMSHQEKEGRKNFLNYFYVIRKLCELSGFHWLVPRFRLLKHAPRLETYDIVWERLVKRRGWAFIKTEATTRNTARMVARLGCV